LRLDIVIPAHNEERRIDPALRAYRRGLPRRGTRLLVAMDACTDRTAEIVERHAREDERVQAVAYPKLGKGGVIMRSFERSDADLVGFVDADGATPPGELMRLARIAEQTDGAIATRRHPASVLPVRRSMGRAVTSAAFATGVRALTRLPHADTQCGAKVLRREVVRDVLPRLSERGLLFDVDLLLAARDLGYQLVEVPTVWVDQEGSRVRPVSDSRRMGASLLALWLRRRMRSSHREVARAGA
jgi:glycosyltransferase involved in cell wall biosynthesis